MKKEKTSTELYHVSDVCRSFGITRKTLFYYDRIGLLKPSERIGSQNYKVYDEQACQRLAKIVEYRHAGLQIEEIRKILDDPSCDQNIVLSDVLNRLTSERNEIDLQIMRVKELIGIVNQG